MPDIIFNCPECANPLKVDESGAGMIVDCPQCSKKIQIPGGPPAAVPQNAAVQDQKPCPFCGEQILAVAKKCKHCGEMLEDASNQHKSSGGMSKLKKILQGASIAELSDNKPSFWKQFAFGSLKNEFFCPNCGKCGCVYTREVKVKSGIHGGKITGALLTGGLSLLVTGLSRKEQKTQAYCDNCKTRWKF